ncbi:MAG: HD domain-containing protein [Thaumarchaeota archaeon]|nr:HD domain-containing protein [Nitrososphaerota archaeon]
MKEAVLKVYEKILGLKRLKRTGWIQRGIPDPESVAAHSYAVALLSIILAYIRGINPADAALIALIHDLPEADTGDLTPQMKKNAENLSELELQAIKKLAEAVPEPAASKILEAWTRYREGSDAAARLVRAVDKLEMGLQALAYIRGGHPEASEIYESALKEVEDDELRSILREAAGELT